MPRNEMETRVRGWIRKNTRIGPVLKVKVCYRDDRFPVTCGERRQPEIHSSPVREDFQRIIGQTNDCRFQLLILTNSPSQQQHSFVRFKTEVCICSKLPTEAMQWIKEVELVDSVDDLRSSLSVRGTQMPIFEVLDAKIASALNRIIHNSHFQRRIGQEEQNSQKWTVSFVEGTLLS